MKNALLPALALIAALAVAAPASAQDALRQAFAAGQVGEQADGYLGVAPGVQLSADARARMDQVNIGRRAEYTRRAEAEGQTVVAMAAISACLLFDRIPVGGRYRGEDGQWRQRTAGAAVEKPALCSRVSP